MKFSSTGQALQERVVHAGFWSVLLYGVGRMFGFVRTMIVARLLAPDDIGLFALATLALIFVETLSKTGFQSALIHRQGDIVPNLNVAWTVHVFRGFIRSAGLFFVAPAIAIFFDEPAVKSLIQVVAVAMICQGFTNTGVIYLRKELAFHKEFLFSVSRVIADLSVSIAAAIYFRNAWALTYGLVAGYAVQVIVSYKIHPFRPRFSIDFSALRQLFRYGKWMNFTGITIFVGTYAASAIVGKLMNAHALGIYQLGHWIAQAALVELSAAIGMVAFPAYSHIRDDQTRLRQAFIKTAGFTITVTIPIAAIICLNTAEFVNIFLGEKWTEMINPLKLLAVAGCFHAVAITGRPVFLCLGQPYILFWMQSIRAITLLVLIYPLVHTWGVTGAAWAMVVSSFTMLMFWCFRVMKVLFLSLKDFFEVSCPALIATSSISILLIIASFITRHLHDSGYEVLCFIGILIASVTIYALMLRLIQPLFPGNQPFNVFRMFFLKLFSITTKLL